MKNTQRHWSQSRAPRYRAILIYLVCLFGFWGLPAYGQETEEKILFYGSQIDIDTAGLAHVTETIKVRAASNNIRHGIYRSIPTKYRGEFMETVIVPLDVIQVLRDGTEEGYSLNESENGVTIYIGKDYYELPPGDYTYTITYTVDRQIGFFEGYDEFYWNVIGDQWAFTIDSVAAVINLPPGTSIRHDEVSAYIGAVGETGCDCRIMPGPGASVSFQATRPMDPYEGFTVAVPFAKGSVRPPSRDELIDRFLADNYPGGVALISLAIVLAYYFVAWLMVGIDPRGKTIIPRFEPPRDLAPYELRYVKKMGFDNKTLVACLVWLAQNGHFTIEEKAPGSFTLTRAKDPVKKPEGVEKAILDQLFANAPSITLGNSYNPAFGAIRTRLKGHLKENFGDSAFRLNRPWIVIGILMSVVAIVYSCLQHPFDQALIGLFLLFWVSGWTVACVFLVKAFIGSIRNQKYAMTVALVMFLVPFLAAEVFVLALLLKALNFYAYVSFLLLGVVNIVFFGLLRAPTLHGRRLLDEIESFSLFLRTAEMPRIESLTTTPAMDLNLFQQYLPYALALDLQTEWARHFEDQLSTPEQTKDLGWYRGISSSRSLGEFSSSFGRSLSSGISSSSTPPGSRSGSGGRGFSGGGGGGGGGGGW